MSQLEASAGITNLFQWVRKQERSKGKSLNESRKRSGAELSCISSVGPLFIFLLYFPGFNWRGLKKLNLGYSGVSLFLLLLMSSAPTMAIHHYDHTHDTTRSSLSVRNGPLDVILGCPQVDEFNSIFFYKQNARCTYHQELSYTNKCYHLLACFALPNTHC